MKLLFSFPKQRIIQPTNNNIQQKNIITNIPLPVTVPFGSMFERMKHTGKCNSCSGAR